MTGAELIAFAALIAVVVTVWLTLFFLFPLNARARFRYRATVLRDTCLDAVFDGQLPRTAPVDSFLARANAMATHPEFFTLTRAWAVHRAMTDLGCEVARPATYTSLNEEQRQLLCKFEDDLVEAFGERLVRGSSFGSLLWLASMVVRLVPRSKEHSRTVSSEHLAEEYSAMSEKVSINGRKLVSLSQ